jgi:hypothetical protein
MATMASIPPLVGSLTTSPSGYPWQDGDVLYADDLNAAFAARLEIGGPIVGTTATFSSDLTAQAGTFHGPLLVDNAATFTGAMVAEAATFEGAVGINNTLTLSGPLAANSATFAGPLTGTSATFSSDLAAQAGTFHGPLEVDNLATFTGAITAQAATFQGAVGVNNTLAISGQLSGQGATFAGRVTPGNIVIAHGGNQGIVNVAGMSLDVTNGAVFENTIVPVSVNRIGTTGAAVNFLYAGGAVGSISVTASVTAYNTTSDGRLKEDARPFDAGPIIDALNACDFAWKSGGRAVGVIAQEAYEIFPGAVTHDEPNDTWGVDYSKFVPLLLAELKALRQRVAKLEG